MKPGHHPSLELCKKLPKEICNSGYGYAECQWLGKKYDPVLISKEEFYSTTKSEGNKLIDLHWIFIETPSIAELLDELPGEINEYYLSIIKQTDGTYDVCYQELFVQGELTRAEGTLPNALAEMWLWLKENNYL